MSIARDRCVRVLADISSRPTAPFYEARVAAYILGELRRMGLSVSQDDFGNIIALYAGDPSIACTTLALVAHMDHPGFEVTREDGTYARLIGGVRKECFDRETPVRVFHATPEPGIADYGVPGKVIGYDLTDEGVCLRLHLDAPPPSLPAFGIWDLPDIEVRDDRAYLRAADDLAGCASILLTIEMIVEQRIPCRLYAVFTRAEEAGFVGAIQVAHERLIPDDALVISLETSKELPGAEIGSGPVVRVGDRLTTFDMGAESLLRMAWNKLCTEDPAVRVQRQLMSGGTCEGSVFLAEGYRTAAMALPLGNYHNVGLNLTIEPEYIHLGDLATQVDLLLTAATITPDFAVRRRQMTFASKEEQVDKLSSTYASWPKDGTD